MKRLSNLWHRILLRLGFRSRFRMRAVSNQFGDPRYENQFFVIFFLARLSAPTVTAWLELFDYDSDVIYLREELEDYVLELVPDETPARLPWSFSRRFYRVVE